MYIKGLLFAVVVILVWGVTFVNTKALLKDFSALEIQVLRFALGWLALTVFGGFENFCKFKNWKDEKWFFFMGLFGVALYQFMENCAIHYTNASNVSILVCMCPLLTAVAAYVHAAVRHQPLPNISPLFYLGFLIAITGVVMVCMNGVSELHFNFLGDILAAVAMFSWVIYSTMVSEMNKREYSQVFVIRRMFFWTLVLMIPLVAFGLTPYGATAMDGSFKVTLDPQVNANRFSSIMNYVNLGFLGLLASAACFVLWNKALGIIGTVRCTVGLYLLPAITVVFAYMFLGETMSLISAAGALLILVGVVLSSWKKI